MLGRVHIERLCHCEHCISGISGIHAKVTIRYETW
jgi:hypothetical protein